MALRLSLLVLLCVCAPCSRLAHGTGDAIHLHALQQHAEAVTVLENDFLSLIETAAEDERFNLYWTYNQLMGTWLQVDLLQSLLELSVAAASPSGEDEIGTALRDQAQFALWEINQANTQIEENIADDKRPHHVPISEAVRLLLSEAGTTIARLLVDQCARVPCAVVQ